MSVDRSPTGTARTGSLASASKGLERQSAFVERDNATRAARAQSTRRKASSMSLAQEDDVTCESACRMSLVGSGFSYPSTLGANLLVLMGVRNWG